MKGKYFFEPKRNLFWKTNQGTRGLCYALCTVLYSVTVGVPAWLLLVTVQLKLSLLKYIFQITFIYWCVWVCARVRARTHAHACLSCTCRVRGHLSGVESHLPLFGSQGCISGQRAWGQVPVPVF